MKEEDNYMGKKILVLSGSPRKGGNTDIMTETFVEAAKSAGNDAKAVYIRDNDIAPCRACDYCAEHKGVCVIKDDMYDVLEEMKTTDVIVFASPIYWFMISAKLKIAIDRFYSMNKVGFHITSAAMLLDSMSPDVFGGSEKMFHDMCGYLKWKEEGIVTISGMLTKGAMKDSPDLEKVRELAANI